VLQKPLMVMTASFGAGCNTCPKAGQVSRRHATNRNRTP
jgi:hypothetical protein